MAKHLYKIVEGKHQLDTGEFKRQGAIIELDSAEVAKFPNKFQIQVAAIDAAVASAQAADDKVDKVVAAAKAAEAAELAAEAAKSAPAPAPASAVPTKTAK